jgi:hypothetical protein
MARARAPRYAHAFARLPALHAAGLSVAQLAAVLRVAPYTVRRWLVEHRLARRTHTVHIAPTVRRAVHAVQAGASISATAQRVGVAYGTLYHWCSRAGVVSQHRPVA